MSGFPGKQRRSPKPFVNNSEPRNRGYRAITLHPMQCGFNLQWTMGQTGYRSTDIDRAEVSACEQTSVVGRHLDTLFAEASMR